MAILPVPSTQLIDPRTYVIPQALPLSDPTVTPVTSAPRTDSSGGQQNQLDTRRRFSSSAFLAQLIAQSGDDGAADSEAVSSQQAAAAYSSLSTDEDGGGAPSQAGSSSQPADSSDAADTYRNAYFAQYFSSGDAPIVSGLAQKAISAYETTNSWGSSSGYSSSWSSSSGGTTIDIELPSYPGVLDSGRVLDMMA